MLYRKFYAYGMSITLRYTKSKDEAIEVLNDSFLKVYENIGRFDVNKSFKSWFRQITVNTAIDHYRKSKRQIQTETIETYGSDLRDEDNFDELDTEDIINILNALPDNYRVIFNLYEIEGYDHKEIGEQLGISDSTSRANLSRAKQMLRELFKKQYNTYAGVI
jgi:RNA polymerase sigma-70 factor (ECF subfamily)